MVIMKEKATFEYIFCTVANKKNKDAYKVIFNKFYMYYYVKIIKTLCAQKKILLDAELKTF
jgi:hypothetical protein